MTSNDSPRVFFPPPLTFTGLVTFGVFLDGEAIVLGPLQITGAALGVAGLGLTAGALGLFRKSDTRPEPWQPANALITRGIYRVTRNPMYLGMAMLSLGVALVFSSFAGCVMAILAAVAIDRIVIPREEAYLMRRFGHDFGSYARGAPRWL